MGGGYTYKQVTGPWEGADYRPNDLERDDNAASDMLNAHITPDNVITQRPGTIPGGATAVIANLQTLNSAFQGLTGYIPPQSSGVQNIVSGLTPSVLAIVGNGSTSNIAYTVPVSVTLFSTTSSVGLMLQVENGEFHLSTFDSNNNLLSNIGVGMGSESAPPFSLAQFNTILTTNGIGSVSGSAAVLQSASIVAMGPFDTRPSRTSGVQITRAFQVWSPSAIPEATDANNTALNVGPIDLSKTAGPCDSITWNQTTTYFTYLGKLWKYDGVRAYTPGPPVLDPRNFVVSASLAGNVDVGAHYYVLQLRYYYANGGSAYGPMITSNNGSSAPFLGNNITIASTAKQVSFQVLGSTSQAQPANSSSPVMGITALSYSQAGAVGTLTFTSNPFVAGDQIIMPGAFNTSAPTLAARMRVTAATPTTVTLDAASYTGATLPNPGSNFWVSRNVSVLLWRGKVGGTTYYYAGEFPFNTTAFAAVTDNVADANLGGAYVYPTYVPASPALAGLSSISLSNGTSQWPGGALPYFKYLTVHQNLLVAASGNTVFYSLPANFDTWSADQNSFTVPTVANEQITAIKSFGGVLYIWTSNSMFHVTGLLPQPGIADTTFLLTKNSGSIGCINNRSVTVVEERIVWMDQTGLYSLTPGAYPVPIDEPLRPLYLDIAKLSGGALTVDTGRASYDPLKKLFYVSLTTQSRQLSLNPMTLVWNLVRGGLWEVWSNLDTRGGNVYLPGYGPYLVGLGGTLARFSDSDVGMSESYLAADGVLPIPFQFTGPWEEMGAPSVSKDFTRFRTLVAAENSTLQSFTLTLQLQRNYSTAQAGYKTMDFNSAAGFGLGIYGVAPLGDPSKDGLNMKLQNTKARALRPVFTHNKLYEKIRLQGWEYEISPDFKQNKST